MNRDIYRKMDDLELKQVLYEGCKHDNLNLIKYLLETTSTKKRIFNLDPHGENLIIRVCRYSNIHLLDYVLNQSDIQFNIKKTGIEALMAICRDSGSLTNLKYLLNFFQIHNNKNQINNIDINFKDSSGFDIFLYACSKGFLDIIQYLLTSSELKEHANINSINKHGSNALMIACANNHINVVQYLLTSTDLKNQLNINFTNNNGENALMWACRHGNLDIVKYLLTSSELKEHANIHYKDNSGDDIFKHACKSCNLNLIKYLIIDIDMNIDNNVISELEHKNSLIYKTILPIINCRNLYEKLNDNINTKEKEYKRIKI